MTSHYTAGFTSATNKNTEITGGLMVAPRNSVSGPSLFGPGTGSETIRMRQSAIGLACSVKF